MRTVIGAISICFLASLSGVVAAQARPPHGARVARVHRAHQPRRYAGLDRRLRRAPSDAAIQSSPERGGIVTINTAAGLPITVASSVASKFQGFIGDLVAEGYKPHQIHCLARTGHVRNSNHHWGGACDIDQSGRDRTAGPMYHVAALARKWGLRDGCTFGDCGHVDVPRNHPALFEARFRNRGFTG